MSYPYGNYSVVRYPQYYVVIDESTPKHDVVFESRSREAAHRKAKQLYGMIMQHIAEDGVVRPFKT